MAIKFKYDLAQCYLEMARAAYDAEMHTRRRNIDTFSQTELNIRAQASFLTATLTIIYSYLAIEAFVNNGLYSIWKESRRTGGKKYPDFYKFYGHIAEFKRLKDKGLKDLERRIKVLCTNYQIPPISTDNSQLWEEFKVLLKEARHFIIHPFPDPSKFQKIMKTVQEEQKYRKWAEIAEKVIRYFFEKLNRPVHPWLEHNQFFAIKEFIVTTRPEWLSLQIKEGGQEELI